MKFWNIGFVLLIIVVSSASCTTATIDTRPLSITVPAQHDNQVNLVISDEDLNRKELVGFGLVGTLFHVEIDAGEMLRTSALRYFKQMFSSAGFDNSSSRYSIQLTMNDFSMKGIDAQANLTLGVVIVDNNGAKYLDKIYTGSGSSHGPMYFNERNQEVQVKKSTEEAFKAVFENIAIDVANIDFT